MSRLFDQSAKRSNDLAKVKLHHARQHSLQAALDPQQLRLPLTRGQPQPPFDSGDHADNLSPCNETWQEPLRSSVRRAAPVAAAEGLPILMAGRRSSDLGGGRPWVCCGVLLFWGGGPRADPRVLRAKRRRRDARFQAESPQPEGVSFGGSRESEGKLVSRLGLEPRTPALKGQCSTIELPAHILLDVTDSKRLIAPQEKQSEIPRFGRCHF